MNLSSPFINRPVMTTFITILIAFSGILAAFYLPITDLPSIEKPHIEVNTSYHGALPLTVLNHVTIPLEKELVHIKGLQDISSQSSSGLSTISLSFNLNQDMNEALREVQAALMRAEPKLPAEIDQRPSYQMQEAGKESIIYILLTSAIAEKKELEEYAEKHITPKLGRIEGVSKVRTFGLNKSLWLRLDPDLMAARKITFNQVVETLKAQLSKKPLGSIQSKNKTLAIELSESPISKEMLEKLLILNTKVSLKDIGDLSTSALHDQNVYFVTPEQTATALLFGIQKTSGSNTVAIAKNIEKALDHLKKDLPSTYHLNLWFNKAKWIENSIKDVEWSLLFAVLLVVLVIYLSLGRWIDALIPSVALPLSLLGTLSLMYVASFSLDLLSLLALTLSVGFVVDDAIVVLENIVRHQENGESPLKAALNGSSQIGFTILSMTLSLVAVFIPLLFMGGMDGRLFREFSITIAIAILVSGFISLTLTPLLCSRFLSKHIKKQKGTRFIQIYGKMLKPCLKYPLSICLFAFGTIVMTFFLFSKLPVQLVPDEDRGFIAATIHLPKGSDAEAVSAIQSKVNNLVLKTSAVESFINVPFEDKVLLFIRLKPIHPPQNSVIQSLQKTFDATPGILASLHGYQMIHLDFEMGSAARYKYILRGETFEEVEIAIEQLAKSLKNNSEFTSVKFSQVNETPKLQISIDENLQNHFGLNKQNSQDLLNLAFGEKTFEMGSLNARLHMEMKSNRLSQNYALEKLTLKTNKGNSIPLKAIADWKETLGPFTLTQSELLPAAALRFSLKEGVSPSEGIQKMETIAKNILPQEIKGEFSGSAKMIASNKEHTTLLLLAAISVMYLVLGILYESFIHPLTILSSLPFALLGGVLTLLIFNEPLSLFSAVGFLLLIGIVKKNGIMMLDYANEMQKAGYSKEQAIYEGCLVRFRPIMMTTFAACMGAIPLAIGFGEGGKLHQGLGLVIIGGLIFSQGFTLFVTPAIYLFFEKIRTFLKSLFFQNQLKDENPARIFSK